MLGSVALPFTSGFVGEFLLIIAVFQYQAALGVLNDQGTSAKLTNAQTMCSQATPVGAPPGTVLAGTAQPIAPIGVG